MAPYFTTQSSRTARLMMGFDADGQVAEKPQCTKDASASIKEASHNREAALEQRCKSSGGTRWLKLFSGRHWRIGVR